MRTIQRALSLILMTALTTCSSGGGGGGDSATGNTTELLREQHHLSRDLLTVVPDVQAHAQAAADAYLWGNDEEGDELWEDFQNRTDEFVRLADALYANELELTGGTAAKRATVRQEALFMTLLAIGGVMAFAHYCKRKGQEGAALTRERLQVEHGSQRYREIQEQQVELADDVAHETAKNIATSFIGGGAEAVANVADIVEEVHAVASSSECGTQATTTTLPAGCRVYVGKADAAGGLRGIPEGEWSISVFVDGYVREAKSGIQVIEGFVSQLDLSLIPIAEATPQQVIELGGDLDDIWADDDDIWADDDDIWVDDDDIWADDDDIWANDDDIWADDDDIWANDDDVIVDDDDTIGDGPCQWRYCSSVNWQTGTNSSPDGIEHIACIRGDGGDTPDNSACRDAGYLANNSCFNELATCMESCNAAAEYPGYACDSN